MSAELDRMAKSLSRRQFLAASMASAAGLAMTRGNVLAAPEPRRALQTQEEYVWIGAVTAIAFWLDGQQGFHAAGNALGVKTTYLGPVEYDPVAQMNILEQLIASKPAGIMIFPADDQSLNDPLKQAMAAGIPVVVVNHDVNDPTARYGFVGPDNVNVGRIGGQAAAKFMNGRGKVGFVTTTNPAHGQRVSGYKEVFAKYPDIQIVGSVDEKSDPNVALTVSTQLLQANPDLTMAIGIDATAGAAIGRALKETGLAGKVMGGAMDRDDDMLPYIKDGTLTYSMAQNSVMEEWMATHYLYWLVHNTIPAFPDWRAAGAPQVPGLTDTGVTLITKDNVDHFFHR
ncbi:MAG TPA: substrate-binding domain-containing protein [Chloroflexota bacterium]|nr:substrate-binding domain-containing protein [Chloroflexota bacterium]HEX2987014.1 substrate-binding domain-containing protein [Chloroflexota bacterium]